MTQKQKLADLPDRAINVETGEITKTEGAFELISADEMETKDLAATQRQKLSWMIELSDLTTIQCVEWVSEEVLQHPDVLVIAHHGLGGHTGRIQKAVEAFFPLSVRVLSFDVRGHGLSGGRRGDAESVDELIRDFREILEYFEQRTKAKKIFLFAHSMGGGVIARYLSAYPVHPKIKGAIFSSPAIDVPSDWSHDVKHMAAKALYMFKPDFRVYTAFGAQFVTSNQGELKKLLQDPLIHRWLSARLAKSILESGQQTIRDAHKIKVPVLAYHSDADKIVGYLGTKAFVDALSIDDKQFYQFSRYLHEIHHEDDNARHTIFDLIQNWMKHRIL